MNPTGKIEKRALSKIVFKIIVAAMLIGFLSALLAITLKKITQHYEAIFLDHASGNRIFFFLFPLLGLSVIYLLRLYVFHKKENKGIREIFDSTGSDNKNMPFYKIPSHFINGLLTVIFGGSTGIEVSTVVASATIGSVAQQKESVFQLYKTEFISAGVAAGITALFCSPVAGIFFALEVIAKKMTNAFLIATIVSVSVAFGLLYISGEKPLFELVIEGWRYHSIPFYILFGIIAGANSVYLTRCVLLFKAGFAQIEKHLIRMLIGVVLLSLSLLFLPELYGDGYHAIKNLLYSTNTFTVTFTVSLIAILIFKPIVTSATLAAGGDGGVFAPSLFLGAFLGLLTATVFNTYFDAQVIPLNFMVIGMAGMLSATIHAPFTALFLVCGIIGDYKLFVPILIVCLISKYTAKMIYPFTVYTFHKA